MLSDSATFPTWKSELAASRRIRLRSNECGPFTCEHSSADRREHSGQSGKHECTRNIKQLGECVFVLTFQVHLDGGDADKPSRKVIG